MRKIRKDPQQEVNQKSKMLGEFIEKKQDEGNPSNKKKKPYTMAMATKDRLHQSISDGSLKEKLDKLSNSANVFQSTVNSFSQIVDKAQKQMESQSAQVSAGNDLSILSDMWVPMFLNLIETSEFQGLMASMLIRMIS